MCGNATYDTRSSSSGFGVCRECCYGDMCNNKVCGDDVGVVQQCHESLIFGRAVKSVNLCRICCDSDLCNDRYTENELSTTAVSLTTQTTTTTTTQAAKVYRDCDGYYRAGHVTSGIYTISPDDVNTFAVYCDMEDGDGGWIVLQHRFNGSVLFNRSFSDYENGFGQLDGEFWLGLKKMYILAHSNRKVRFNLQALDGTWLPLEYGEFSISNASLQYTLHVANHTDGFAACSFGYNNGHRFVTYDKDTDNCANDYFSGWWYNDCTYFNINGHFGLNEYGVFGYCSLGRVISFQKTMMMIQ